MDGDARTIANRNCLAKIRTYEITTKLWNILFGIHEGLACMILYGQKKKKDSIGNPNNQKF